MEKVKTFLADISDLLNEKNYQKIYKKVPAFRQEKADRLKHREDQAQSVGAWYLWMKIQERHKIPQDAGQSFNLSHSGKYVLCSAGVSGDFRRYPLAHLPRPTGWSGADDTKQTHCTEFLF